MNRRESLENIIKDIDPKLKVTISNLIDEIIFMEERMKELKKLPFIQIHPKDSSRQKLTSASKQYKDLSQSYMNSIRILISIVSKNDGSTEDDPVSNWMKENGL